MTLIRADFAGLARDRIRVTPGTSLDPAAVDATGSNVNILVNAAAAMAEECESRSAARFADLLVATAVGPGLDRLILERSKGTLPRLGAAAADVDVVLIRPTSAAGAGTVDAGTELSIGGYLWTLDRAVTFGATDLGGHESTATCESLGSAPNGIDLGAWSFKNPSALFDPSLIVGTTRESGGGAERESDADYAARYARWDAGTDRDVDRMAAGARSVPGVATATVVEALDASGLPNGLTILYVADDQGRASTGLLARVRAALRGFRGAGQRVRILGTSPAFRSITLSIGVLDGYNVASVQEAVRAAVVAAVNKLTPGATLQRALLTSAIASVPGAVFLPSVPSGVVTPAADLIPASISVIYRTTPGQVSFT